jgi:putative ABC transport system permease protein
MRKSTNESPQPPRAADRLLEWFVAPHLLESLQGDLHEEFAHQVRLMGERRARRRYWRDVLGFFRPFAVRRKAATRPGAYPEPFYPSIDMISNHFKIAWRSLLKSRLYGAITVTGLGVSMATCLLIYAYVAHELSFDRFHAKRHHIYRLNEITNYPGQTPQMSSSVAQVMGPYFHDKAQGQIEEYVRLATARQPLSQPITLSYGAQKIQSADLAYSEPSFFRVFDFEVSAGDRSALLKDRSSFVVTEKLARRLFGNASPLNRMVKFTAGDTMYSMRVAGVLADLPAHSHIQLKGCFPCRKRCPTGLHDNYGVLLESTYLLLRPGVDAPKLQMLLDKASKQKSKNIDIRLQALGDVHLGSINTVYESFNYRKSDYQYVYIFIIVGLLIFGISCINFINLTIVRASSRSREVGVKRVIGAARHQIYGQFISEAALSAGLATVLAIGLAIGLLPWINGVLDRDLAPSPLFLLPAGAAMLGVAAITAGVYPAWVLTSFNLTQTLLGKLRANTRQLSFGRGLIVGQFTIAIGLTITTLIVARQLQYMRTSDPGFQREQVVGIRLGYQANSKLEVLKAELRKQNGVTDVTASMLRLGGTMMLNGVIYRTEDGKQVHVSSSVHDIAPNYLSFYGFKIKRGRNALPNVPHQYFVNEAFVRKAGWRNPVGQTIGYAWLPAGVVVGVVKDFHFNSLREGIEPAVMRVTDENWTFTELSIKVAAGDMPATLQRLQTTWGKLVHDQAFSYQFLDEHFDSLYRGDQQAGIIVGVMSGLAIFIACLGLFSLSAYTAQQRTKEIGIRKVLGASVGGITALLAGVFLKMVAVAMLIACPLAWYVMNKWLQSFAYKISMEWWMFAGAGALAATIALLTVGAQSIRAAVANPVKSLRSE